MAFLIKQFNLTWMQTLERCTLMPLLLNSTSLNLVSLWWRSQGSGVLSLCFSCCQGVCTRQAACHTGPKLPWCPHASFSLLAPLNHAPPTSASSSATWVMTTPGTLSPRCHFCHWISCWLQPYISCLLFSAHVLTLNCLEKRKRSWGGYAKKKKKEIDQGPGKLQKKYWIRCL